jgi:hypothetical protein
MVLWSLLLCTCLTLLTQTKSRRSTASNVLSQPMKTLRIESLHSTHPAAADAWATKVHHLILR